MLVPSCSLVALIMLLILIFIVCIFLKIELMYIFTAFISVLITLLSPITKTFLQEKNICKKRKNNCHLWHVWLFTDSARTLRLCTYCSWWPAGLPHQLREWGLSALAYACLLPAPPSSPPRTTSAGPLNGSSGWSRKKHTLQGEPSEDKTITLGMLCIVYIYLYFYIPGL